MTKIVLKIFCVYLLLTACSSAPSVQEIKLNDVAGRWTDREEKNIWDFEKNGSATFLEKIEENTYSDKIKYFDLRWELIDNQIELHFSKETVIIGNVVIREKSLNHTDVASLEKDTFFYRGVLYFHVENH